MSYQLGDEETVQKSIRRIGRKEIDKAIDEIDNSELDRHQVIHQVRKRCKKLRALVRLVRPAMGQTYQRENAAFHDIAAALSVVRDEQSMVESLERLLDSLTDAERRDFEPVLTALQRRQNLAAKSADHDTEALLIEARQALKKARNRIARWQLEADGFKAVGGGFHKTYKRGHKAARRAFKTDDALDFHEWRKRVKYHAHHLQLLRPLWPRVTGAWRKEAKTLADILGNDHDLAMLDMLLESEGEQLSDEQTRQKLQQIIRQEQQRLRQEAWLIGQRLYAEKPKVQKKRFKNYWQIWQASHQRS